LQLTGKFGLVLGNRFASPTPWDDLDLKILAHFQELYYHKKEHKAKSRSLETKWITCK